MIILTSELESLYNTVLNRKRQPSERSYTSYLFREGTDKILKKCGEECSEVIIAAKNGENEQTVLEISDLLYHLIVLMADQNITLEEVLEEIQKRSLKINNLKNFHQSDKNS